MISGRTRCVNSGPALTTIAKDATMADATDTRLTFMEQLGEPTRLEQKVSEAFVEACVAMLNSVPPGGQVGADNKFRVAADAISAAWPEEIQRYKARMGFGSGNVA